MARKKKPVAEPESTSDPMGLEPSDTVDKLRGMVPKRWHKEEGIECARAVMTIASQLGDDQKPRKSKALEANRRYSGTELEGLAPGSYVKADANDELFYPLHNSGVETVVAQIGGRQKPKPQIQTSGADWQTKRRAKKCDKLLDGIIQQPHGCYQNAWELTEDALLRDSLIVGTGVIHVRPDYRDQRVRYERVHDHELLVDPAEAAEGEPKNLFWEYNADIDQLIAEFVDEEEDEEEAEANLRAILATKDVSEYAAGGRRVVRQARVVQAWHLPTSSKNKGRHVICIEGRVLFEREWKRPRFPFVRYVWSRHRGCLWWGQGIVELGESIVREVNEGAVRMQERVKLSSNKRTYYRPGSIEEEKLQANDAEVLIPVQEGHDYPQETLVPPFTEQERAFQQDNVRSYYDFLGIPQSQATGRKEPGVNAAVAMRTLNDIGTLRQAPKAKRYEYTYVELARCTMDALDDLAEDNNGKIVVKRMGSRALEEYTWEDVRLPDDSIEVSIAPASSLPNDPAGRLSMIQELYGSGVISAATFRNLLGWPDLESEMSSESAEYEYLEQLGETYLDAVKSEWGEGDYESPEGFIVDKNRALIQFAAKYWSAKLDKAPEFNLTLLRNYIMQLDDMIAGAQMPPPGGQQPMDPMAQGAPPIAALPPVAA
jgi:hypothetical protein